MRLKELKCLCAQLDKRKMGVAYDSLVQVVTIAGVAALVFLIISLVGRYRTSPRKRGAFKKMPLLLPAIAFTFALILSYLYVPLPISAYRGANTGEIGIPYQTEVDFTVYDAEAIYYNRIDFRFGEYMYPDYAFQVTIRIYEGATLADTVVLNLYPPATAHYIEDEDYVWINPGRYNVTGECLFYIGGELQEDMGGSMSPCTFPSRQDLS
jgi:hypothetical protein